MLEDEDPFVQENWKFQRDYFKEIPYHTLEITHYETVVLKLGRLLYLQEIQIVVPLKLTAPLIKMKIKDQWKDWESSHPKMGRAGYMVDPTKQRDHGRTTRMEERKV